MPAKKTKREDGRFMVSVEVGRTPEGKRLRKYFYGTTQREAEAKKRAYLKAVDDGIVVSRSLLSEWITAWVASSSPSEKIRKSNAIYAKKLSQALGHLDIKDVRMIDIKIFAQSIAAYSFSYVKKCKCVVWRIFQDAVRSRIITFNPCDGVVWEHGGKGTHRALESWERELITVHASEHRCGIWAMLMLYAGLRRGEALALTFEDIDFGSGIIHVRHAVSFEGNHTILGQPKTEAGVRDVPLLPQLRAALEAMPTRSGAICTPINGGEMTQSAFKRGWTSYIAAMEAILNDEPIHRQGKRTDLRAPDPNRKTFSIRTHDLRHTFATMLYNAGIGLKEAQYLMGHADTKMTLEVYTHLDAQRKNAAADILKNYADKLSAL